MTKLYSSTAGTCCFQGDAELRKVSEGLAHGTHAQPHPSLAGSLLAFAPSGVSVGPVGCFAIYRFLDQ